jgi:hypothetical protein
LDWAGLGDGGTGAVFGRLACGDQAATFGDGADGEFPLQAAPKAASDAVAPRLASLARGVLTAGLAVGLGLGPAVGPAVGTTRGPATEVAGNKSKASPARG